MPDARHLTVEQQGSREHEEERHSHHHQCMIAIAPGTDIRLVELHPRPRMLHDNQQNGYRTDEVERGNALLLHDLFT